MNINRWLRFFQGKVFDKKFDVGIYTEAMKPMMEAMAKNSAPMMKECMSKWKCADIFARHEHFFESMWSTNIFELMKRKDSRFNVMCHGDIWANNVMFKYNKDSGKVEECLLVDFQISNYNSPMLDLLYFIYSSTRHDIKMQKVDQILHYYHAQLVANLKKLGYKQKLPTLLQFQKDFLELGLFGLTSTLGVFAIAVCPPGEDADLANFMKEGDTFTQRVFNNPAYVQAMEDLIPFFELKGYILEDY